MTRRRTSPWAIPRAEAKTLGANIRVLRQRNGWTQAHLGQLMGWAAASTVCGAEGGRDGRQRGFTVDEVRRLAAIFGREPWQLTTRCMNCEGHPRPDSPARRAVPAARPGETPRPGTGHRPASNDDHPLPRHRQIREFGPRTGPDE